MARQRVEQIPIDEVSDPDSDKTLSWGFVRDQDGKEYLYFDECTTSDGGDNQTVMMPLAVFTRFIDSLNQMRGILVHDLEGKAKSGLRPESGGNSVVDVPSEPGLGSV